MSVSNNNIRNIPVSVSSNSSSASATPKATTGNQNNSPSGASVQNASDNVHLSKSSKSSTKVGSRPSSSQVPNFNTKPTPNVSASPVVSNSPSSKPMQQNISFDVGAQQSQGSKPQTASSTEAKTTQPTAQPQTTNSTESNSTVKNNSQVANIAGTFGISSEHAASLSDFGVILFSMLETSEEVMQMDINVAASQAENESKDLTASQNNNNAALKQIATATSDANDNLKYQFDKYETRTFTALGAEIGLTLLVSGIGVGLQMRGLKENDNPAENMSSGIKTRMGDLDSMNKEAETRIGNAFKKDSVGGKNSIPEDKDTTELKDKFSERHKLEEDHEEEETSFREEQAKIAEQEKDPTLTTEERTQLKEEGERIERDRQEKERKYQENRTRIEQEIRAKCKKMSEHLTEKSDQELMAKHLEKRGYENSFDKTSRPKDVQSRVDELDKEINSSDGFSNSVQREDENNIYNNVVHNDDVSRFTKKFSSKGFGGGGDFDCSDMSEDDYNKLKGLYKRSEDFGDGEVIPKSAKDADISFSEMDKKLKTIQKNPWGYNSKKIFDQRYYGHYNKLARMSAMYGPMGTVGMLTQAVNQIIGQLGQTAMSLVQALYSLKSSIIGNNLQEQNSYFSSVQSAINQLNTGANSSEGVVSAAASGIGSEVGNIMAALSAYAQATDGL